MFACPGVRVIYVKMHKRQGHICTAACDEELLGRTLEEDPYHVTVKEEFFEGELVEDDDGPTSALFRRSNSLNLFGERSVAMGIECGCIDPAHVIRIQGVPHAQMYEV